MKARILIADDSVAMRGHLDKLIRSQPGWEMCAAVENGQEAVLKAAELKPDLILIIRAYFEGSYQHQCAQARSYECRSCLRIAAIVICFLQQPWPDALLRGTGQRRQGL